MKNNLAKVITISCLVLVVGLCIGGFLIYRGVARPSISKVEELKTQLETKKSELEAKVADALAAEKQKLEDKKAELMAKGIKYESFAKYDDGETYDLKIITNALDPSFDNCLFDEYKNNALTSAYCLISNKRDEDSKNLSVIKEALDESFDHCKFNEAKNNTFTKEYCAAKNSTDDYASSGSTMLGVFICIASCMFSGFIFMVAKRRHILAFSAQQVMPVAQEGIEKVAPTIGKAGASIAKEMAPVYGEVAKDIAKGIKEGLNEADKENEEEK